MGIASIACYRTSDARAVICALHTTRVSYGWQCALLSVGAMAVHTAGALRPYESSLCDIIATCPLPWGHIIFPLESQKHFSSYFISLLKEISLSQAKKVSSVTYKAAGNKQKSISSKTWIKVDLEVIDGLRKDGHCLKRWKSYN